MLEFILWSLALGLSLFLLIKSSDYFITYSEKIGLYFGLPCFVIGIIILAFGTSLPELVSSIVAVIYDSSEIVLGNVIGSNIANIFLILGFIAYISRGLYLSSRSIKVDLAILLVVSAMLLFVCIDKSVVFFEGIIFVILIGFYTFYSTMICKSDTPECYTESVDKRIFKNSTILLATCFLIYISSDWTIKSVINLSDILLIPREFIAITVVAFGTSLPELIVSSAAMKKGNVDMALGNIIGSCIFNTLAIVGTSALFGSLIVTKNILLFAFPVLFLAVILLAVNCLSGKISRANGGMYLSIYFAFILALYLIK